MQQYLDAFSGMLDVLGDPQRMHAVAVHLPIAIAMIGLIGVLVLVATAGQMRWLPWTLVALYFVGMVAAWYASETGESAEEALATRSVMPYPEEVDNQLKDHAELGEWLWVAMAIGMLAVMMTGVKQYTIRMPGLVLSAVAAFGILGYVALIAHHGGSLVYVHGVGAPSTDYNTLGPPPGPDVEPRQTGPTQNGSKTRPANTTQTRPATTSKKTSTTNNTETNTQNTKSSKTSASKTGNQKTANKKSPKKDPDKTLQPELPAGSGKSIFDP